MTDRDYTQTMDGVCAAIRTAALQLEVLDDGALDDVEKTIAAAETIGFMLIPPFAWGQATERLEAQREAVALARRISEFWRRYTTPEAIARLRTLPGGLPPGVTSG